MVMLIQLMAMVRHPVTSMSCLVDASQRAIAGSTDYFEVMDQLHDRQPGARILAAIGPVQQSRATQEAPATPTTAASPDATASPAPPHLTRPRGWGADRCGGGRRRAGPTRPRRAPGE